LPHLPFPGLLCDGPPMARLRKIQAAFFCHRQRRPVFLPAASPRIGFFNRFAPRRENGLPHQ
ncbi:MAG: hypothetical protein II885_00645, partial [Oscillospiraceae bacterium]|nr:hypothetical protein [Oscillospiraceae bacterium]